jgi:hypothetical protein
MTKTQTWAHLLETLLPTGVVQEPQKRVDSPYHITVDSPTCLLLDTRVWEPTRCVASLGYARGHRFLVKVVGQRLHGCVMPVGRYPTQPPGGRWGGSIPAAGRQSGLRGSGIRSEAACQQDACERRCRGVRAKTHCRTAPHICLPHQGKLLHWPAIPIPPPGDQQHCWAPVTRREGGLRPPHRRC